MAEITMLALSKALVFICKAVAVVGQINGRSGGPAGRGASRRAAHLVDGALRSIGHSDGTQTGRPQCVENALNHAKEHLQAVSNGAAEPHYHVRFALRNLEAARKSAQDEMRRAVLADGSSSWCPCEAPPRPAGRRAAEVKP